MYLSLTIFNQHTEELESETKVLVPDEFETDILLGELFLGFAYDQEFYIGLVKE